MVTIALAQLEREADDFDVRIFNVCRAVRNTDENVLHPDVVWRICAGLCCDVKTNAGNVGREDLVGTGLETGVLNEVADLKRNHTKRIGSVVRAQTLFQSCQSKQYTWEIRRMKRR
jgi:hypothetical protein